MPRNSTSSINFNIDIKGINDAQQLTTILPKLIKQFRDLSKAVDTLEKAQGTSKSGPSRRGVSDAISRVKLGISRGDIQNVKQLTGHYGQLVRQINQLEKSGENVNSLRLRAFELYKRERKQIDKTIQSKKQSNKANLRVMSSTDNMRRGLMENIGTIKLSEQANKQAAQAAMQFGQAQKNASFLILNAGYLIQDSPYGIRGMANNVSQLAQAYMMLSQRIEFLNRTQGANLTVWKSLKSLLVGPTGWVLLIGSIMPAAVEHLSNKWDDLTGGVKDIQEELESYLEIVRGIRDFHRQEEGIFGDDPMGLIELRREIRGLKEEKEVLDELAQTMSDLRDAQQQDLAMGGHGSEEVDRLREKLDKLEDQISDTFDLSTSFFAKLGFGTGVSGKLEDTLEELNEELTQMERKLERSSESLTESQKVVRDATRDFEFFEKIFQLHDVDSYLFENEDVSTVKRRIRQLTQEIDKQLELGEDVIAARLTKIRDQFKGLLEDGGLEELDIEVPFFDIEEGLQAIQSRASDINALRQFFAEQAIESAETVNAKIEAARELHTEKLRELGRKFRNNELNSEEDFQLQREQLILETEQRIDDIREDFRKREEERQKEAERRAKEQHSKMMERLNRRQQLESNYAQFAINTGQAIANALDSSARAQFQINKIASASQAVMNGYLAYTKTLAQGGFLALPLAKTALLLSFAQAANIMSQSYDSARSTGVGQDGTMIGYRGIDFQQNEARQFSPFLGSNNVNGDRVRASSSFPSKVDARFLDGFGKVVSTGTLQLQSENKEDNGYWSNG